MERAFTFVDLSPDIDAPWDALVTESNDGWPFALSGWQRLILAVKPWGLVDKSFAVQRNENLVAVLPLQFNLASKVIASSGWGGCGPILACGLSRKQRYAVLASTLSHAEQIGRELGAERFEFWLPPATRASIQAPWGMNPFVFFGFNDNSGVSQVVDLSPSEEELWRGVSETARHAISKARRGGIVVEEAPWPEMLDEYYAMHAETYTRTGVPPHPKAYFEGIAREMWPLRHSILWVARNGQRQPIAFHNAVWFRDGAFYHTACSKAEALESGANYLLFWHALMAAKASGIRWYDCGEISPGEASSKQQGLTTFKTKFGGEAHRFFKCAKNLTIHPNNEAQNIVSRRSRFRIGLANFLWRK